MNLNIPNNIKGLSSEEARRKLALDSYNELPQEKNRRFWQIAKDVLKEPMLALLLACGLVYLLLGDTQEALVLLFFVLVVIFITIYQENKTEKALAALRSFSSPKALVLRDGKYIKIPGREVMREDVVFLNEGDRIPADGVLLWTNNLNVNESLLTGESLPLIKNIGQVEANLSAPGEMRDSFVYSGTTVLSGQGIALIKNIGRQTEIGKIGQMMSEIKEEKTKIQTDFARLIKYIAIGAIIFCLVVALINFLISKNFLPSFLIGITLAMSLLPEELPVILAVFFSIGAWRMSRQQVLIKKMSMVESLGAATVLCVDKTGTLTLNKMKIKKVFLANSKIIEDSEKIIDVSFFANNFSPKNNSFNELIKIGALACRPNTFDPLEKAIKELKRKLYPKVNIYQGFSLFHEYPLSHECLAHANVWEKEKGFLICVKGAPETIADLCSLNEAQRKILYDRVNDMAQESLRVLAVARRETKNKNLPENLKDFKFELAGLLGFMDPIRSKVPESIRECYRAGIKVKMITGDYPATAQNIAHQIGLENYQQIVLGSDFINCSESELEKRIKNTNVFARMIPENKLQIIKSLKRDKQIVVMTGDGVNDGPALKAANIGVAMGERGTDVAREAAGIILLDDDFSSLVRGVKSGRRVFDNLKRAMVYTLATHIPIAGLALIPILLGWPLLLFPAHIMFLELIIDPVCSVVFEAEPADKKIMRRRPRNPKQAILTKKNVGLGLIQGTSILITVLLIYKYSLGLDLKIETVRALSFSTLIFANIFLILVNRSWTENSFKTLFNKNRWLWPIILIVLSFLALIIYTPFLQATFHFAYLDWKSIILALGAALVSVLIFEILKVWRREKLI